MRRWGVKWVPSRSLRFCNHPGCGQLTTEGYCPEHMADYEAKQKTERNANRESPDKRGYDALWSKARKAYLQQRPLCEQCERDGIIVPAALVHHIKPIDKGGDRLNPENFMALCRDCHEKIHGRKRRY